MFEIRDMKPRTITIGFRVSEDEKTVLERLAQERNMRIADLARVTMRQLIEQETQGVQCDEQR